MVVEILPWHLIGENEKTTKQSSVRKTGNPPRDKQFETEDYHATNSTTLLVIRQRQIF